MLIACDSELGCTVIAGETFVDPDQVAVPVFEGTGYNGQFIYRQSLSPLDFSTDERSGIRLDNQLRASRIGFPLVVWVASAGGQPALIPPAMLLVNVLSIGGIAAILAAAARRAGHSIWWGLAAAAVPGIVYSSGRSLADPCLHCWQERRPTHW